MDRFDPREIYVLKKALAVAILAIEQMPGALQPTNDAREMKRLLGGLVGSAEEMAQLQRSARIAVNGSPE